MSNHRVAVVVDREFGERLLPLSQRLPVWICDTPINREAAGRVWATLAPGPAVHEYGVTTFGRGEIESPEDMAARHVGDIDLHHPEWSQIEVYGVRLNDALRAAWREYGATEFHETQEGFVCSRPSEEETE